MNSYLVSKDGRSLKYEVWLYNKETN